MNLSDTIVDCSRRLLAVAGRCDDAAIAAELTGLAQRLLHAALKDSEILIETDRTAARA